MRKESMYMKVFRILARSLRDSVKSIFRNFSFSVGAVFCIFITLTIVALAMVVRENVNGFTEKLVNDVTMVVFLDEDVTLERFQAVGKEIRQIDNVGQDKNDVIGKDKVTLREELMKSSDTYKDILEKYTTRDTIPLKDTYTIKVEDISKMDVTAKALEKIDGVNSVKYGEGMVARIINVVDVIRKILTAIVIGSIIVSASLITSTIKLTIDSRQREIDIMRLVGASNTNIKIPFMLEGLFLGILGSIIPILITTYGYSSLYDYFDGKLFGDFVTLVKPNPFIFNISGMLLLIGMIVGMFGSWRAVRKHLKI